MGYFSDYPKCVFFILGNEFCERFSFYGMKAILVIYLTRALNYSENDSTAIYHGFNMVCYFTPLFGAMLADGLLGKYWTIFSISILYSIGNAVMAFTAFPPPSRIGMWIGLLLIGVGTGGIKPCVSAFGGDQFEKHQVRQQASFFSVFYMSINLGSLLSMILTPILRSEVKCFGGDCYPLAFGVPAALMLVALVFFIVGTKWYKRNPAQGNIIGMLFGCIGRALRNRCRAKQADKEHWLFYADDKYDREFIVDVRAVLRVLFMFIPLPVFWALFDQQGSRWTLQAGKMDGEMGSVRIQPDMIQAVNPILILALVPILESAVFPCLDKLRIPNSPLQRLGCGMVLAALAFVIAALLQIRIDDTSPKALEAGYTQFKFINAAPCDIKVESAFFTKNLTISYKQKSEDIKMKRVNFHLNYTVSGCLSKKNFSHYLADKTIYSFVVVSHEGVNVTQLTQEQQIRTLKGRCSIRIVNGLEEEIKEAELKGLERQKDHVTGNLTSLESGPYWDLDQGDYELHVRTENMQTKQKLIKVTSNNGAVKTVVVHKSKPDDTANNITAVTHEDLSKNTVNILWQIPQYFVMTLGECFFSITGLSFAYSQAPMSMKSVLQAGWLLTNSFGNLIVIIISKAAKIPSQTIEFLVFAGLMLVTVVIFALMGLSYKYVEQPSEEDEEEKKLPPGEGPVVVPDGTLNPAFKSDLGGEPGIYGIGFKKHEDTPL